MEDQDLSSINLEEEIKKSYLDYALSVIIGRAIPDIRDGLKPVQRRIIFAMHDMGNTYNRPYKKSARIVGDVIGKYHPHGESAVYDAIVRLAQDFSMRYPLIDGQGNFGSTDGDPPAAMRYTEVRLHRIADELLKDIEKDTVPFLENYDSSTMEPEVLPSRIPNLLVNGSSGIAVGMATNIPPHNMGEIIDALILILENPEASLEDIFKIVQGPDFPTGGIIFSKKDIQEAYRQGRGSIKLRAQTYIEKKKGDRLQIIVHELPYQVNKSKLLERINELAKNKVIEGIDELRDETDREGTRIVIELKRKEVSEVVLNKLFKHTQMEINFGIILLAIDHGIPRVLPLKDYLEKFLEFRNEIIVHRTRFELNKAREECHILEGLKKALDDIDLVLNIIRGSEDAQRAKANLMRRIKLDDRQAQAILDMRLQRLTKLEKKKLLEDYRELLRKIKDYQEILADENRVRGIIKEELIDIRSRYADPRKTQVMDQSEELNYEDLIFEENMVVTITKRGYIKRTPLSVYRTQKRGGKGIFGISIGDNDYVEHLFIASTHTYLLIFTDIGKVYWMKVHEVPEGGRTAKGRPIVNLLPLQEGEKVTTVMPVKDFEEGRYIAMVTKGGHIKKTDLKAFSHPRYNGIIAINLDEQDKLISAVETKGGDRIFLASRKGMSLLIDERDVRPMQRNAKGVKAIRLRKGDELISMINLMEDHTIFTLTEKGYGKRTEPRHYRIQRRGGLGLINIRIGDKNGEAVDVFQVKDEDQVVIITNTGKLIRIQALGIKPVGRSAMGVKVIKIGEEERVVAAQKVVEIN